MLNNGGTAGESPANSSSASTTAPTHDRERRAYEWIGALVELPERFAGTWSERQAAERIATWMRELGIQDVSIGPTPGGPRGGLVLAIHAGVAALGCWWGGFVGVLLAALAAWSFRKAFQTGSAPLASVFSAPESLNVVGRVGAERPAHRVVLSAHIDAAQAGWIFSPTPSDRFARFNRRFRRDDGQPQSAHAVNHAMVLVAVVLALGAWLGAHGWLFGLARALAVIGLLIACGSGLQWAASRATPGANDNASAVAAMLICAERLLAELPAEVELWLVGTGAEEVGCKGMHGFVDRHLDWPMESTYFVNFECVGGGALHYIRSEGLLGKLSYPPLLNELARRVAAGGGCGEVTPTDLLAATDGHVPAARGYATLSLISLEANGVPRNYHRPDDTVERIDCSTVVRAADFGAAVALAALRGEAGPISPEQHA